MGGNVIKNKNSFFNKTLNSINWNFIYIHKDDFYFIKGYSYKKISTEFIIEYF